MPVHNFILTVQNSLHALTSDVVSLAQHFTLAVQNSLHSLSSDNLILTENAYDADAQAYITAVGIIDDAHKTAINTFVLGLKANSLWAKVKALYPMYGSTAEEMKWNLMNPLNTDAAFRLTYTNNPTFTSKGMKCVLASGAFANTYFNPSLNYADALNVGMFVYISDHYLSAILADIGVEINPRRFLLGAGYTNALTSSYISTSPVIYGNSLGTSMGLTYVRKTGVGLAGATHWKNGIDKRDQNYPTGTTLPNGNAYLGGYNDDGVNYGANNRTISCAGFTEAFSDAEVVIFSGLVNALMTAFNRNIYRAAPIAVLADGSTYGDYDFDFAGSIIKDGSNYVSVFGDSLGMVAPLLQATALKLPLFEADGLLFDGSNDYMKTIDNTVLIQPETLYFVLKNITHVNNEYMSDGKVINRGALLMSATSGKIKVYAGAYSGEANLALDTFAIVRVRLNGASSKLQVNAEASVEGNFGAANLEGFAIGGSGAGSACVHMKVKRIIIRKVADTPADETTIYNYLKATYGL